MKNILEKIADSLYYAKDNHQYIITSTPDLAILKSLGIVKNAKVQKILTYKFGGPVLIMLETSEIAIGKDIAEQILVRRIGL